MDGHTPDRRRAAISLRHTGKRRRLRSSPTARRLSTTSWRNAPHTPQRRHRPARRSRHRTQAPCVQCPMARCVRPLAHLASGSAAAAHGRVYTLGLRRSVPAAPDPPTPVPSVFLIVRRPPADVRPPSRRRTPSMPPCPPFHPHSSPGTRAPSAVCRLMAPPHRAARKFYMPSAWSVHARSAPPSLHTCPGSAAPSDGEGAYDTTRERERRDRGVLGREGDDGGGVSRGSGVRGEERAQPLMERPSRPYLQMLTKWYRHRGRRRPIRLYMHRHWRLYMRPHAAAISVARLSRLAHLVLHLHAPYIQTGLQVFILDVHDDACKHLAGGVLPPSRGTNARYTCAGLAHRHGARRVRGRASEWGRGRARPRRIAGCIARLCGGMSGPCVWEWAWARWSGGEVWRCACKQEHEYGR
ncbi:hypothetical protein DFH09DRAFT_1174358, partial [Mycena vulgaris]